MAKKSGWIRRMMQYIGLSSNDPEYSEKKAEKERLAAESKKKSLEFHPGWYEDGKLLPADCLPDLDEVERVRCTTDPRNLLRAIQLLWPGGGRGGKLHWSYYFTKPQREDIRRLASVSMVELSKNRVHITNKGEAWLNIVDKNTEEAAAVAESKED